MIANRPPRVRRANAAARVAVVLLGVGGLLAACGGGGAVVPSTSAPVTAGESATAAPASPSEGASTVPARADDVCATLTISAVMAAVGGTDPKGTTSNTDDHSDCAYTFSTPSSSGPVGWQVDVQVGDSSAWDYQQGLPSVNRTEVSALGDAAFTQSDAGERDLWVKRGDRVFSFSAPERDETEGLLEAIAAVALGVL